MTALKAQLKFARLNYKAAKARGDAAACRKYLEQIADLKGRRKGITKARTFDEIVADRRRRSKKGKESMKHTRAKFRRPKPAKAERIVKRKSDRQLADVKWFRRELDNPTGQVRKHALGKLEEILSPSELADVLTAGPGEQIVRKSGRNPGKSERVDNVAWLVEKLADRSLPVAERNAIVDRLTIAAAGNKRALDAVAKIVGGAR